MASKRLHRRPDRKRRLGLTAVETTMVVSVVGVLLATFVPEFLRVVRLSKTSEVALELDAIDARVLAYYRRSHSNRRRCLPSPAGPTPEVATPNPRAVNFMDDDNGGHATWKALGYRPKRETRFRYVFDPVASGCNVTGAQLWRVRAEGDLDGDGKHSRFERASGLRDDGTIGAVGVFHVLDRTE